MPASGRCTFCRHDGAVGALLRFRSGAYAPLNDPVLRALDRLEVLRAMTSALTPASADP